MFSMQTNTLTSHEIGSPFTRLAFRIRFFVPNVRRNLLTVFLFFITLMREAQWREKNTNILNSLVLFLEHILLVLLCISCLYHTYISHNVGRRRKTL